MSERRNIMAKIYLIANTNFNSDNVNNETINSWNDTVEKDDLIYHLGNFGTGSFDELKSIFNKLNGNKYLIMGEKDTSFGKDFFLRLGFKEVYDEEHTIGKYVLTHYTKDVESNKINIYGSNTNEEKIKDFKNKNYVCVSLERISFKPIMLKEE